MVYDLIIRTPKSTKREGSEPAPAESGVIKGFINKPVGSNYTYHDDQFCIRNLSNNLNYTDSYYNGYDSVVNSPDMDHVIVFNFTTTENFKTPVYVFYEIGYNYQNLTNYHNSKSLRQLAGYSISQQQLLIQCYGNQNFNEKQYLSYSINKNQSCQTNKQSQVNISQQTISNPCGFLPRTYFNDTFFIFKNINNQPIVLDQMCSQNNNCSIFCNTTCKVGLSSTTEGYNLTYAEDPQCSFSFGNCCNYSKSILLPIKITKQEILETDSILRNYYRNNIDEQNQSNAQWTNKQDQRFIKWMSNAGLPHSPIMWGKIDANLSKNELLTITIFYNHDSQKWDGYRALILSNSNKPRFAMALVTAIMFIIFAFSGLTLFFLYFIYFRKVFNHARKT